MNADTVGVHYPHAFQKGASVWTIGRLLDACTPEDAPHPDLVLLSVESVPSGIMPLELAFDESYEIGESLAVVGLRGRDPNNPQLIQDVTIEGSLSPTIRADGRRQFFGRKKTRYWFEKGSSGSPVFVLGGQHVAGIISMSEFGGNSGKSHLREALVVRGRTIRDHVVRVVSSRAAINERIPFSSLQEVLDTVDADEVPVDEIPERIRLFVEASRAHAAEPRLSSNLGSDIDEVVDTSRSLVGQFKPEQALDLLQKCIDAETELHARRMLPLLRELAAVQHVVFDSAGAQATLDIITSLDQADVWSWLKLGDLRIIGGDSLSAAEAYEAARVAAIASGDDRDLMVSYNRVGDALLVQGEGTAALEAYRLGLTIAEKLAGRDPSDTECRRDLSISHNKIGNVLATQGEGEAALKAYQFSRVIRERLVERDPSNTEWQRDLSISHNKIGDVLVAQGDGSAALNAYRTGLNIAKTLAKHDPSNLDWQRDLSISYDRIGNVLMAQGNAPDALAAYRIALAIAEKLTVRDPTNTEWQCDLIVYCVRFSEAFPKRAKAYLERAATMANRLHETGRLNPADHWMVDALAELMAALSNKT